MNLWSTSLSLEKVELWRVAGRAMGFQSIQYADRSNQRPHRKLVTTYEVISEGGRVSNVVAGSSLLPRPACRDA